MDLGDFRVEGSPDNPWADIAPLGTEFCGAVLAFDQSLGHTGWVYLQVDGGDLEPLAAGSITTEVVGNVTITEDAYLRSMKVEQAVVSVFERHVDLVVMELPPTGARQLKQVTSSLMAGYPIYATASRRGCPVEIIQGQKAKRRWTGNPSASKSMVREALVAQFPWVAKMRPLNEHTTDAVLLALTALDGYAAKKS